MGQTMHITAPRNDITEKTPVERTKRNKSRQNGKMIQLVRFDYGNLTTVHIYAYLSMK